MAFICSSSVASGRAFTRGSVIFRHAKMNVCATVGIRTTRRSLATKVTPHSSIETEVSEQIKQAMKAKDAERLKPLRSIRAAFLTALKAEGAADSIADKDAVSLLRKLAKMHEESIDMYVKGGRDDLADDERRELLVIEEWLPTLASKQQMTDWGKEAIEKTNATGPKDMGKVIGFVMKDHREEVDGNELRKILTELLKGL